MNIDERWPARNPGVTVRHGHHGALVQAQHIVNIGKIHQRVDEARLVAAGVAKDIADIPGLQRFAGNTATGDILEIHPAFGFRGGRKDVGQLAGRNRADTQLGQRRKKLSSGQRAIEQLLKDITKHVV